MSNPKIKSEGEQGGKRGHSRMEHWLHTDEIKEAARKVRRIETKKIIREELKGMEEKEDKDTEPSASSEILLRSPSCEL